MSRFGRRTGSAWLAAAALALCGSGALRSVAAPEEERAASQPAVTTRGAPATRPTTRAVEGLARRLLSGGTSGADAGTRTVEAMRAAESRLSDGQDLGGAAREQSRALAAIDELIAAAKNADDGRSAARPSGSSGSRTKRGARPGGARQPGPTDGARRTTSQPAAAGSDRRGLAAETGEKARRWGFLPPRDRAELLQGADESYPAKYREAVERYYRSLAEEGSEP